MIQLTYAKMHVNIWPDTPEQRKQTGVIILPQIEVWTARGQSQVLNGFEAITFVKSLNAALEGRGVERG